MESIKLFSTSPQESQNSTSVIGAESSMSQFCETMQTLIWLLQERIKSSSKVKLYDNKGIKKLLGIEDKLLKKYRDEGLLGFSKVNDKYWYRDTDVLEFLTSNYYPAFATAS